MITFKNGNLFEEINNVEAIVNTVNLVGVMGKGIALAFKEKYPENNTIYKKKCNTNEIDIGKSFVYEVPNSQLTKYIINLPTKKHWRNPSQMEYIEKGLDNLIEILQRYHIKSIAMPALGCGNGKLDWDEVKPLIIKKLEFMEDVKIIIFEPAEISNNKLNDKDLKKKTKPRLTQDRKKILLLLNDYNNASSGSLGTYIQFQILSYLLNYKNKNMKFELNHRGPYFEDINNLIKLLRGFYIEPIETTDLSSPKQIKVLSVNFPSKKEIVKDPEYIRVKALIKGFESDKAILVLSIVHWFKFKENVNVEELPNEVFNWLKLNNFPSDMATIEKAVNRIEKIYFDSENLSLNLF